ncbi:MAG: helix-turn-helix domain-containing protein, partial [Planctomycetota bacterium]
ARGRKTAKVKPAEAKPTRRRKATAIKPAKDATRSHGRTRKSAIRKKKKPAARVSGANGAPRKSPGNGSVTGKAVARLRAEFGLSQSEFARLLGVSAPCVNNWEKKPGKLDLRPRTRDAWNTAKALTKHKARRKLDG